MGGPFDSPASSSSNASGAARGGAYGDGARGPGPSSSPGPSPGRGATRPGAYGDGSRGGGDVGGGARASAWRDWSFGVPYRPPGASRGASAGDGLQTPSADAVAGPGAGHDRTAAAPGAPSRPMGAEAPSVGLARGGGAGAKPAPGPARGRSGGAPDGKITGHGVGDVARAHKIRDDAAAERRMTDAAASGRAPTGPLPQSLKPGAAPNPSPSAAAAKAPSAGPTPAPSRTPIPPAGPVAMPDEDYAALQHIAEAWDGARDFSAIEGELADALALTPADAVVETRLLDALMRDGLSRTTFRASAEAAGRKAGLSAPLFQGLEDDPRSAHGRAVDPLQAPPRAASRPQPATPATAPIRPDDSPRAHHEAIADWYYGDRITQSQSQEQLDAMINLVRVDPKQGWGEVISTDPKKGPHFEVPDTPEEMRKFLRAQEANPDAEYLKKDRVTDDELQAILDAKGLSGIQEMAYVMGPDGYLYHRVGNPAYIDPEATLERAVEMMAHHSVKFDVPWDEAVVKSTGVDDNAIGGVNSLNGHLVQPGPVLDEALRKLLQSVKFR